MKENFIRKLVSSNYQIGSFDVYLEEVKELIKTNSNLSDEEVEITLKSIPTTYRASILDNNNEFIGYIGLYNIDFKNDVASIRFEVNKELIKEYSNEIINTYKKYINDSINIHNFQEVICINPINTNINKMKINTIPSIIVTNNLLVSGIKDNVLEEYSNLYEIPKLQMPFTIINSGKVLGIIGLSNLSWSNRRANLNIFLDQELGDDIINDLSSLLIDDYINYVHSSNIHNINLTIPYSNHNILDIIKNTNMNYYGAIPFGAYYNDMLESNLLFQHIPNMEKEHIIIPENKYIEVSKFETSKKELSPTIVLENGVRLISPKLLTDEEISNVLKGHIKAMENRDKYTIPLGEDKSILQVGNGNYGLSKAIANYNYLVLDENKDYLGFINILRTNANNHNAEIEIGISPFSQHRHIGTKVINAFYEELFSIGYASITSSVFEFNNPSLRLHDKVAELNGIRLESYYINGKLWDMNIYSRVNNLDNKRLL